MGRFVVVSALVLAAAALTLRAEDDGVAGRGAGGAKPAEGKAAEAKTEATKAAEAKPGEARGAEATKTGTLAEKPVNAAADVVAVLQVKSADAKREKKNKRAGGGAEETINLTATGDVASKIGDLVKKSAAVEVTGTLTGDTMKVSSVTESKTDDTTDKKKAGREGKRKKNQ
ncbi:MAG: hypothetical protein NTW87_32710 [Planctomycetota bacterium]|nr:hypothetical protein [Planctomycetota bacterium]